MLFEHIDTAKIALMGHSTGGGAIILAAAAAKTDEAPPGALVMLAALGSTQATITGSDPHESADQITTPALILDGEKDCICPPAENTQMIYDGLAGEKRLVRLTAGDHCGFSDAAGPGRLKCEMGEAMSCGVFPQGETLDAAEQNTLSAGLIIPWLDHRLRGNASAGERFTELLDDPRISATLSSP